MTCGVSPLHPHTDHSSFSTLLRNRRPLINMSLSAGRHHSMAILARVAGHLDRRIADRPATAMQQADAVAANLASHRRHD